MGQGTLEETPLALKKFLQGTFHIEASLATERPENIPNNRCWSVSLRPKACRMENKCGFPLGALRL